MGAVLREARCTAKPARRNEWERAERAVAGLPEAWRGPFAERLAASRDRGRRARGAVPWSAAYVEAVALALRRWVAFCHEADHPMGPTGSAFDAYAARLLVDKRTARTIADYLGRICAGFAGVLDPGAVTEGARFVADEWDRRAKLAGATTKTAAGVVPASAIYDLGFDPSWRPGGVVRSGACTPRSTPATGPCSRPPPRCRSAPGRCRRSTSRRPSGCRSGP